jgi:sugar phosphate isomerase/epimerase
MKCVELPQLMVEKYNLKIAAVGTGAGKVIHGLTLTDPDAAIRKKAIEFIESMITFGAAFGAPAIIGSMQGNVVAGLAREQAMQWLADGLIHLGKHAASLGVKLIYEPLNRYETNLINTLGDGVQFLKTRQIQHVGLLADLFHMNIEEADIAASIKAAADLVIHVHFADSNRRPIGFGHTEMNSVAKALQDIGYSGYVSAEAFPWPDSDAAAAQTIEAFTHYFTK